MPRFGKNPAAFSHQLMCPRIAGDGVCGGTNFKFVEEVQPFMYRYRCKKCGKTLKYEFSNNPDFINQVYGKNTKSILEKVKHKYNLLFR
jgi:hypothetical protein